MSKPHPAPKDPQNANRDHDETRRRLDGPAILIVVPLLIVAVFFAFYGVDSGRSDLAAAQDGVPAGTADAPLPAPYVQAKTIELPHLQPILPPGRGLEAVQINCVTCHSPRLITNQPDFTRAQWTDTVHKMVNTFGAHVTPEDQEKIIDYLVFIRGS